MTGGICHRYREGAWFQYRKRYEITCDSVLSTFLVLSMMFQYRKRYEITCDIGVAVGIAVGAGGFQYRKRYEITCDVYTAHLESAFKMFQYRKRYEITCDVRDSAVWLPVTSLCFNTASGMRSHVTRYKPNGGDWERGFNTASGMRSHVTG